VKSINPDNQCFRNCQVGDTVFYDLPNINLSSNPKPPIPLCLPISHFNYHIHIVCMFLLAPEVATYGGMVYENEGCAGIALPEFS
jgi:hypothetical protein